MNATRNLVLTVSIGERPWFPILRPYMQRYAERWNADFEALTASENEPVDDLVCRQRKIDAIYQATERWDRVLYVDDTVFIRPMASLLRGPPFGEPKPPIWATLETHLKDWQAMLVDSFDYYGVNLRELVMLNSGVMLVAKEHQPMFDRTQTQPLKKVGYLVDQLWVNAMRQKHGIPVFDIGPKYNYVGSFLNGTTPTSLTAQEAHFFHLTRALGGNQERLKAAAELVQRFG